jgi:glycosyltransferase EpsH
MEFALSDSRICVFTKPNEGIGAAPARNYGLARANGEYIIFLDSDDFFEPDMLEKMVARSIEYNADVVICNGYVYDNSTMNKSKSLHILNPSLLPPNEVFSAFDISRNIFQITKGEAWNKLFRRNLINRTGVKFQPINYTDDAFFTYGNMLQAESITIVDEYLVNYRVGTFESQTDYFSKYPDSMYLHMYALKNKLEELGVYKVYMQSFHNYALEFFRLCIDTVTDFDTYRYLYNKCKIEVFPKLEIQIMDCSYYDDVFLFEFAQQIASYSPEETLFSAVRVYSDKTTAPIRFIFPYEKIPRGSKIIIVGAGIIGTNYYAQMVLKSYCDVVLNVEWQNSGNLSRVSSFSSILNVNFDYVLIAYSDKELIAKTIAKLSLLGVPIPKIIS